MYPPPHPNRNSDNSVNWAPGNAYSLNQNDGPSPASTSIAGKMAIPRLMTENPESSQAGGRPHRRHVSRACEGCRTRKIKCDGIYGENCRNCTEAGLVCVLTEGKREKSKRQLLNLEEKLSAVESGFRKLGYRFIGSSSEISWLQTVSNEIGPREAINNEMPHPALRASHTAEPIAARNYYIEPPELPFVPVDIYFYPPRHIAENLFKLYIETVNPSFPIIGTTTFRHQFASYSLNPEQWPGNKWLAILNLTFAIGAAYSKNLGLDCGQETHETYFTRAKRLSMEQELLHHPDLQQIQVEGLASFYMLATGQMNRSWKLCGNAVLGAISLGLHVGNLGNHTTDDSKEIRYRVWWALYTLEHRLSVITGRPSCISDSACSTPLPIPFEEQDFKRDDVIPLLRSSAQRSGQLKGSSSSLINGLKAATTYLDLNLMDMNPNNSLYFLQMVMITSIGRRAVGDLYKPEATHSSWQHTKHKIQGLLFDVNAWLQELPATTKIEITRPCLYRLDLNDQDPESREFCARLAVECIESACLVVNFMPDPPTAMRLYQNTQWWCLLHFLMQALAILLLEIALESQHAPQKAPVITKAAKKVLKLLRIMSRNSASSERARQQCEGLLRQLGIELDSGDEDSDSQDVFTSKIRLPNLSGKRSMEPPPDSYLGPPTKQPRTSYETSSLEAPNQLIPHPYKAHDPNLEFSAPAPDAIPASASLPFLNSSTESRPASEYLTALGNVFLNSPDPGTEPPANPTSFSHQGPPPKSPGPRTELSSVPRPDTRPPSPTVAPDGPPNTSYATNAASPSFLDLLHSDDPF
ncbi:hypothetical protein FE257_012204 [Aspergillus nanangensis]|uniref:Zn(2)-C6 fungal-type domain-containing protein n=1 Tax=Aspergillus nanangensis TaxID=2582783 RepID=A0AAD4GQ40_ASPNN|nr:hypothetical protein FE257_012204 [Aspergillus nanangensis]